MRLICDKCDCEMTVVWDNFSTRPNYWICPTCKFKVRNVRYME